MVVRQENKLNNEYNFMKMTLSKKTILYVLISVWIVFSVAYIISDVWGDFKNTQILSAYEQGRVDTINTLITEAENCQPFSIFSAEKQIQLININCLEITE